MISLMPIAFKIIFLDGNWIWFEENWFNTGASIKYKCLMILVV